MLANQYETLGDPTLPTELSGVLRAAVERWATQQLDKPTLAEAVRRLSRGRLGHGLMKQGSRSARNMLNRAELFCCTVKAPKPLTAVKVFTSTPISTAGS